MLGSVAQSATLAKGVLDARTAGPSNAYVSNGWDLIAASTQDALNAQLKRFPGIPLKKTVDVKDLGLKVDIDITLGAPQLQVMEGSGRQVKVNVPTKGTIKAAGQSIDMDGQSLEIITNLLQIEASLQPHKKDGKTIYDFILNVESKDAIVNLSMPGNPPMIIALLVEGLKQALQNELGDHGKSWKVASFTLGNLSATAKALIPYVADFSFVRHPTKEGNSNLLILMQTVTKTKGDVYFNAPLLPDGENFMVMMANRLFLENLVLPPLIDSIKKEAKDPNKVAELVVPKKLSGTLDLYQLTNTGNIDLNKDHDPWIQTLTAQVDTKEQAVELYIDVKADATFMKIHVDAWDRSWQKFEIDKDEISLKQCKEDHGSSHNMEWWKWLLSFLFSWIFGIVASIIYAITGSNEPDLGGTFKDVAVDIVTWPHQKFAKLKKVESPSHVVIFVDISFQSDAELTFS